MSGGQDRCRMRGDILIENKKFTAKQVRDAVARATKKNKEFNKGWLEIHNGTILRELGL